MTDPRADNASGYVLRKRSHLQLEVVQYNLQHTLTEHGYDISHHEKNFRIWNSAKDVLYRQSAGMATGSVLRVRPFPIG